MLALLWGRILPTKRKMALSEGSWIRFRMIHMNWATDMSLGTRNFFLSMSGIEVLGTFSTMTLTWKSQNRNDYLSFNSKIRKIYFTTWPTNRNSLGVFGPNLRRFSMTIVWLTNRKVVSCQQNDNWLLVKHNMKTVYFLSAITSTVSKYIRLVGCFFMERDLAIS